MDSANFTLRLIDQVSGPAKNANRGLNAVEKGLRKVERGSGRSTRGMGTTQRALRQSTRAAKEAQTGFGDFLKAGLATSGIQMAVGAIKDLGVAIVATTAHLVSFGQSSLFAFNQLAKHGASGSKIFEHARALAVRFGLDVEDTTHSYANFLKLQFNPKQADELVRMGADLRGLGASAEDVKGIFLALGQIKSKGKFQAEEMLQLAERGVSGELVSEELQKALKKSKDAVAKLQQKGKITADVALGAIKEAIKRKLNEQNLGDVGAKFADTTLDGITGRFKALATDAGLDLVSRLEAPLTKLGGGALGKIEGFLDSKEGAATISMLADGLGRAVGFAQQLASAFGGGFVDTIKPIYEAFKPLLDRLGGGDGSLLVNTLLSAAKYTGQLVAIGLTFVGVLAGITAGITVLANGIRVALFGAVGGFVDGFIEGIGGMFAAFMDMGENIKAIISAQGMSWVDKFFEIGKELVVGFAKGIWSYATTPVRAVAGMVGGAIDAAKDLLKSHSPSRVTMGMGGDYGEGYALGIEKKSRRVAGASASLIEAGLTGTKSASWTSWDTADGAGGFSAYGAKQEGHRAVGEAAAAGIGRRGAGGGRLTVQVYVDGERARDPEVMRTATRAARAEFDDYLRDMNDET